ncbi:MAG: hypothetical protein K6C32_02895 [Bacilli bacterium]|nr:hypothetical protein [Bacilli bacterium]
MQSRYQIVIDVFGNDNGPDVAIKGANLILSNFPHVNVILIGDQDVISNKMKELGADENRYTIIDTKEEITNLDNIVEAFYKKENASILLGLKELKENENTIGMLTAGNSGALVMGSIKYLRTDDLKRPCVAAILPTEDGKFVCLVDVGATIDCSSHQLHDFALLGSDFMRHLFQIDSPRIGLLSNGSEETKGNKLTKETYPLLKEDERLNFVGNIEGNKALSGCCDVLVADGFSANQVLKVTEGTAKRIITDIVKYIKMNKREDMMPLVGHLMKTYDISSLGGGIVLGAKKISIKCRGSCNEEAFLNTGRMLINIAENRAMYDK